MATLVMSADFRFRGVVISTIGRYGPRFTSGIIVFRARLANTLISGQHVESFNIPGKHIHVYETSFPGDRGYTDAHTWVAGCHQYISTITDLLPTYPDHINTITDTHPCLDHVCLIKDWPGANIRPWNRYLLRAKI